MILIEIIANCDHQEQRLDLVHHAKQIKHSQQEILQQLIVTDARDALYVMSTFNVLQRLWDYRSMYILNNLAPTIPSSCCLFSTFRKCMGCNNKEDKDKTRIVRKLIRWIGNPIHMHFSSNLIAISKLMTILPTTMW